MRAACKLFSNELCVCVVPVQIKMFGSILSLLLHKPVQIALCFTTSFDQKKNAEWKNKFYENLGALIKLRKKTFFRKFHSLKLWQRNNLDRKREKEKRNKLVSIYSDHKGMCLFFIFGGKKVQSRRDILFAQICIWKRWDVNHAKQNIFFPLFVQDWARFVNIRGRNKCIDIKVIAISFDLKKKRIFFFICKILCALQLFYHEFQMCK